MYALFDIAFDCPSPVLAITEYVCMPLSILVSVYDDVPPGVTFSVIAVSSLLSRYMPIASSPVISVPVPSVCGFFHVSVADKAPFSPGVTVRLLIAFGPFWFVTSTSSIPSA